MALPPDFIDFLQPDCNRKEFIQENAQFVKNLDI